MTSRLRVFWIGFLIVTAATCSASVPSDSKLIRDFNAKRETFRTIGEFIEKQRIDEEISEADVNGLGVTSVYDFRKSQNAVLFVSHTPPIGHTSFIKGYAYSIGPLQPTPIQSLDGWSRQKGRGWRRVEGNWYLFARPY